MEEMRDTGIAEAVGSAMAEALIQHEERIQATRVAGREQRKQKKRQLKKVKYLRESQCSVVDDFCCKIHRQASRAESALADYIRAARAESYDALAHDIRMPVTIDYRGRYNALLRMDDRRRVLARIDQTIGLAERVIESASRLDPTAAAADAAREFRGRLAALGTLTVPAGRDRSARPSPRDASCSTERYLEKTIGQLVEDAFLSVTDVSLDLTEKERSKKELEDLAHKAAEAARQSIGELRGEMAIRVAGESLQTEDLPVFTGKAPLTFNHPVQDVAALAREVRRSFGTLSRVVQDNGLFSAFVSESSYGNCQGDGLHLRDPDLAWRDDLGGWSASSRLGCPSYQGVVPGRGYDREIPQVIEDEPGDEEPKGVAARMEEFNRRRYFGLLDDDFSEHVNAFWFGFKKLMEFVNDLCTADMNGFASYERKMIAEVNLRARDLGARMSEGQLSGWSKDVQELMAREFDSAWWEECDNGNYRR